MSFWTDLGSVISGIPGAVGNAISGTTSFLGDQWANLTGLKHIGEGFGRSFGEDFGKNIPTSFTLNHNVNAAGRIDVGVKVDARVDVGVNVNINLKDAISAAQVLRDGLVRFDLFGGALKQISGDMAATQRMLPMLREVRDVINEGSSTSLHDLYLVEVSLVNDSATVVTDPQQSLLGTYQVQQDCACLLSIRLNAAPLISSLELRIPRSPRPLPDAPRVDREIIARPIVTGASSNLLELDIHPVFANPSGENLLKACRLQVRLIRRNKNWRYTVSEWIFDGRSGASNAKLRFVVAHPFLSPKPADSPRSRALAQKVDKVIQQLSTPTGSALPPEGAPTTALGLINEIILRSFRDRISAVRDVMESLLDLEDTSDGSFDIRCPLFAAISCQQGSVQVTLDSLAAAPPDTGPRGLQLLGSDFLIQEGDELATLIPFVAGPQVNQARTEHTVQFSLTGGQNGGRCTVSVYCGLEWGTRIISSQTFSLDINSTQQFIVPIRLIDSLA